MVLSSRVGQTVLRAVLGCFFCYLWCYRHSAGTVSPSLPPVLLEVLMEQCWRWRRLSSISTTDEVVWLPVGLSSCRQMEKGKLQRKAIWESKLGRKEQPGKKEGGRKVIISTGRDTMAFQLNLLYFTWGKFGSYSF